jgi:uncharacterized protein YgbK (DUF1537 family)
MDATAIGKAVVAPAFPPAGRTTVDGRQLLNGEPLEDTPFALDPLAPVTDSYVPRVLSNHMSRAVGLVELSVVRSGPDILVEAAGERPEPVLVLDAVTDEDLRCIAQMVQSCGIRLACGSAGLAGALAEALPAMGARTRQRLWMDQPSEDAAGPVLVIAASRNPVTAAQLSYAAQAADLAIITVSTSALAEAPPAEVHRLKAQAGEELRTGRSVALTATNATYVRNLGPTLLQALGTAAAQLAAETALAGMMVTGGDAALAVCQALETSALSLVGEVASGIPLARLEDGPHRGMPLVTKAGGFGQASAIAETIRYLQCRARPPHELSSSSRSADTT